MVKRRVFTPDFKAQVVLEELRGVKDRADLCREHQLSPGIRQIIGKKKTFV